MMNSQIVKKRNIFKCFLKGVVSPVCLIFQNKKNFFLSLFVMLICVILTFVTNGKAALVFTVFCFLVGGFQVLKGFFKILKSTSENDIFAYYEEVGLGCFSLFIAILSFPQFFSGHAVAFGLNKNLNIGKELSESLSAAIGSLDDIACLISAIAALTSQKMIFNRDGLNNE